jgi:hypothetical protein
MSKQFKIPEITSTQAEEVNQRLPTFNNNKSRVYQIASNDRGIEPRAEASPALSG